MYKAFYLLFLAFSLLSACNRTVDPFTDEKENDQFDPCLLQMQHYLTESENNLSFPVWFNDSIINGHKIKSIHRGIYVVTIGDTSDKFSEEEELREMRHYYFDRKGLLDSILIEYFYDDQVIDELYFHYSGLRDNYGYRSIKERPSKVKDLKSSTFRTYIPVKYGPNTARYKDIASGSYLSFVPKKKYWGSFSIDTIVKPAKDELLILGTAFKPKKKYFVRNKVHESNVHLYTYSAGSGRIETINRNEYPFETIRTIQYNKEGKCTGFIDSTFTEGVYLTRIKTILTATKDQIPISTTRIKSAVGGKNTVISKEKFEYQKYE